MKHTRSFDHAASSVPDARHFVTATLADVAADVRDAIELMVSELASNCIRHTDSGFELSISQTGEEIRVEATDCGGGEPRKRTPAPTDPSGRGLQIVDMLSSNWGYETRARDRKTVWFSVTLDPSAGSAAPILG